MTDEFQPIRPRTVPLSHVDAGRDDAAPGFRSRWTRVFALTAAAALLFGVFVIVPRLIHSPPPPSGTVATVAATPAPVGAPAPVAASGQDELRARAQAALGRFVELQMQAETALGSGTWGAEAYATAKERAVAGDAALARDDFEAAFTHYDAAGDDLERLLAERLATLAQALQDGATALARREAAAATTAFALAATIEPQDPRVLSGLQRAERLPEVNELMRTAQNHALAEDWATALATLEAVERIDPQTSGLLDAMQQARAGVEQIRLQTLISEAFGHLDGGRHDAARTAFQQALQLAPDNAAALGGLQQAEREAERDGLGRLERDAAQALAEERWEDAEALFAQALQLDPNIQFALAGRAQASERRQATEALAAVLADPDRLSSQRVYEAAQQTLAAAAALDPKGPRLTARIAEVRAVLQTYAEPVAVVLRSDNETQVTVSTVGALGAFTEKQLVLRPGAYTVIGSRDGCRDVRERIVVRQDMAPVEIRCLETL
jgi:tetratricopeptide (TPR) repeat protein